MALALTAHLAPQAAAAKTILFFDPDANHQAILHIKAWFNEFLRDANSELTFQPVLSAGALETMLRDPTSAYAIVASSYLKERRAAFEPILVPTSHGATSYRKLLVDKGEGATKDLSAKTLAATLAGEDAAATTKALLAGLKEGGVQVTGTIVVPVSKDIDALLALSFGQVDAALVTPESLEVLKRINPTAATSFRTVMRTRAILRPPLCVLPGRTTPAERAKLIELLRRMSAHASGLKAMSSLGFDGWLVFEPAMLEE